MDLNFLLEDNINDASRALAHMVFRNGAVEDLHVAGKLSQEDMELLNKDVQNRIAGILEAYKCKEYKQLLMLYTASKLYGSKWDKCNPTPLNKF
ncbi:hypothetical protein LJC49_04570 [Ruminococcaceae bacterium OttesenSCG-928-I18]|nr:hypothetical protein [Ruminococcaceae bacterium OttesenSCG-928-I18]